MNVYPFIEAEKVASRNVARACELLEVSRSAYYQQRDQAPSARETADAELTEQIHDIHAGSKGRYGAPRVHADLHRRGVRVARKRVARLMRAAGLRGKTPRRWRKTTVPDPAATVPLDLIRRDFAVDAAQINTRWCGDITYIHTWEGWLYLATVIDIIGGLSVLNGLGGKQLYADRFRQQSQQLQRHGYRVGRMTGIIQATGMALPTLFVAVVVWMAARLP